MSDIPILLIIVLVVVVILVIVLAVVLGLLGARKRREAQQAADRQRAAELRDEARAQEKAVQDRDLAARETELEADRARLEAERKAKEAEQEQIAAERRRAEAEEQRAAVEKDRSSVQERLAEADRLDPDTPDPGTPDPEQRGTAGTSGAGTAAGAGAGAAIAGGAAAATHEERSEDRAGREAAHRGDQHAEEHPAGGHRGDPREEVPARDEDLGRRDDLGRGDDGTDYADRADRQRHGAGAGAVGGAAAASSADRREGRPDARQDDGVTRDGVTGDRPVDRRDDGPWVGSAADNPDVVRDTQGDLHAQNRVRDEQRTDSREEHVGSHDGPEHHGAGTPAAAGTSAVGEEGQTDRPAPRHRGMPREEQDGGTPVFDRLESTEGQDTRPAHEGTRPSPYGDGQYGAEPVEVRQAEEGYADLDHTHRDRASADPEFRAPEGPDGTEDGIVPPEDGEQPRR